MFCTAVAPPAGGSAPPVGAHATASTFESRGVGSCDAAPSKRQCADTLPGRLPAIPTAPLANEKGNENSDVASPPCGEETAHHVIVVVVHAVSGEVVVRLRARSSWTGLTLKCAIRNSLVGGPGRPSPIVWQRLLHAGVEFGNTARLDELGLPLGAESQSLQLALLVCDVGSEPAACLADPEQDHLQRARAARALGNLGAVAAPHAGELMRCLSLEEHVLVSEAAAASLGKIGEAEEELLEGLSSGSPTTEWREVLNEHIGVLADRLADQRGHMRYVATEALARLGRRAAPQAAARLSHESPQVRQAALRVLSKMGKSAASQTAAVVEALPHLTLERDMLKSFFARVGTGEVTQTVMLAGYLTSEDAAVRSAAVESLSRINHHCAPLACALAANPLLAADCPTRDVILAALFADQESAVVNVTPLLRHGIRDVCAAALGMLAHVGIPAAAQGDAVLELLERPSLGLHLRVASFFQALGANGTQYVETLVQQAAHREAVVRMAVAMALGHIGTVSSLLERSIKSLILDTLALLAEDPVLQVQCAALHGIGLLGAPAAEHPSVLEALSRVLRSVPCSSVLEGSPLSQLADVQHAQSHPLEYRPGPTQLYRRRETEEDGVLHSRERLRKHFANYEVPIDVIAMDALSRIGPLAAPHFAGLLDAGDPVGALALGSFGPSAAMYADSLVAQLSSPSPYMRRAVAWAIGKLDVAATPHFERLLELYWDGDEDIRSQVARVFRRCTEATATAFATALGEIVRHNSEPMLRGAAAMALASLGLLDEVAAGHAAAIAALMDRSYASAIRRQAAEALGAFGAASAPHHMELAALLDDQDVTLKRAAARALGYIGAPAVRHVQRLAALLDADDPETSVAASGAFTWMRHTSDRSKAAFNAFSEVLLAMLQEESAAARRQAAKALSLMGSSKLRLHLDALAALLNDEDHSCRLAAIDAIGLIGASSSVNGVSFGASRVPELAPFLGDADPLIRFAAAQALCALAPRDSPHLDAVIAFLRDERPEMRALAAKAAGMSGVRAEPRAAELAMLLLDSHKATRYAAATAFRQLAENRGTARDVGPVVGLAESLAQMLRGEDRDAQLAAAIAMCWLGNAASQHRGDMIKLLQSDDAAVRTAAADALGTMGYRGSDQANSLTTLLEDDDAQVRAAAAGALGRIGMPGGGHAHLLATFLRREQDPDVCDTAIAALGSMGTRGLSYIVGLLGDEGLVSAGRVHNSLCQVICTMTVAAVGHLPDLAALLDSENASVREAAGRAILHIEIDESRRLGSATTCAREFC